jgi:hypothetical protein
VAESWLEVDQRTEDEGPFVQARVGQNERLILADAVVPEEEVEVDDARSVSLGSDAAERGFNLEESGEEQDGLQVGLEPDDGVHEAGLFLKIHGCRIVEM